MFIIRDIRNASYFINLTTFNESFGRIINSHIKQKQINQSKYKKNSEFSHFTDEGVYNTYVLDSDYKSWALLMHCAEQSKTPRYLSSFIMSREPSLGTNVISYLREKLPR